MSGTEDIRRTDDVRGPSGVDKPIRVLIVDDHVIVRRGLRALLATEAEIEVVGEAQNGREAIAQAERFQPDVILMDLVMPEIDGIEATRRISARQRDARILVLTSFAADDKVFPAIKAGAQGYLLKDSSPEELVAAIHQVDRGELSLHPKIAQKVLQELSGPAEQGLAPEPLTEREAEILRLVARGQSNREIGDRLAVSESDVRSDVNRILGKLHLVSRTQAVLYALQEGLASLDDLTPSYATRLLAMLGKTPDSVLPAVEAAPHTLAESGDATSAGELAALRLIAEDHHKVGRELALAGEIQASFLPEALPTLPGWQLCATLEPARETAGDFYDFIPLSDGRLGLLVADVADKGMGAALYMALTRTLIRTFAAESGARPDRMLAAVNGRMLLDSRATLFVTVFYGILDPMQGTLTYCNAGHHPPYLLRANGSSSAEELRRTGIPLGVLDDTAWQKRTAMIAPGDALVLYTDGVSDAEDGRGTFFGRQRLLEIAQANLGLSAQDMHDVLMTEVHQFVGDEPQADDITLMVVVREP